MTTPAQSKAVLDTIEKLLISEMANPRDALEAAYRLGAIDGMLEAIRTGEKSIAELLKVPA